MRYDIVTHPDDFFRRYMLTIPGITWREALALHEWTHKLLDITRTMRLPR